MTFDKILINDYTYSLPEERIALYPLAERDQSKLLVYKDDKILHSQFKSLTDFIPENSILFLNNTKVIPARLLFTKDTGATIEIFLLDPVSPSTIVALAMTVKGKSQWHCTIGNQKRWKESSKLRITHPEFVLEATLVDREKGIVEFEWTNSLSFSEVVQKAGAIPLPPYLHRKAEATDRERYQTVYSKNDGAVAAPTAGLHFTSEVFDSLRKKNIQTDYLTLHVSAGTFQPVKVENAAQHVMHNEQIVVTRENIENLLTNKFITAVGTTSMRTLESIYWYGVKLLKDFSSPFLISQHDAYELTPASKEEALKAVLKKMDEQSTNQLLGETSIYIMPGYQFKIANALITNFHQPGSTLILLVAAFVGDNWKKIYSEALKNNYRFLSYGDSSLLFRK
jgi:S-adenosylmethionine:tRNA ribosyltransferase-isomerase